MRSAMEIDRVAYASRNDRFIRGGSAAGRCGTCNDRGLHLADDVALFQCFDDRVGVGSVAGFDHDFQFGGLH
jgi:hypothetical protein